MAMHFPSDPAVQEMTLQWMVGPSLLVAPCLSEDNSTSVYLPAGTWFQWGSASTLVGPQQLALTNLPLAAAPVYVRAGAIVPLAPLVQYSDALPGGPLQVHVYGGTDAQFQLSEDDGESLGYAAGAVSTLALAWTQSTQCLGWVQGGEKPNAAGSRAFVQLQATVFLPDGSSKGLPAVPIGSSPGKVCL